MSEWPYPHPPQGTCVEECPLYGYCHCSCGKKSNISPRNYPKYKHIARQPYVWIHGHNFKVFPSTNQRVGKLMRRGMPVRQIIPALRLAVAVYGTQRRVAALLGVHESVPSDILRGATKNVEWGFANRIFELTRGTRADAQRYTEAAERRAIRTQERKRCTQCNKPILRRPTGFEWDECAECRKNAQRPFPCTTCDFTASSDHGLYLHSMQVHGDKTQGRHSWARRRTVA